MGVMRASKQTLGAWNAKLLHDIRSLQRSIQHEQRKLTDTRKIPSRGVCLNAISGTKDHSTVLHVPLSLGFQSGQQGLLGNYKESNPLEAWKEVKRICVYMDGDPYLKTA